MPVNTGPDSNNYSIPEVALNNTFNTWKDQSNISAYKLNKLKVYSGVSSSSVSLTTTDAEGVLTAALLPTVLTGHTFSAGIRGTQAAFHTFNATGSTLTIGSNATAITMGVAGGSATILSHVTITGNFAVTGTQTITNSANFTIADAVISLGQTGGVGVTGASSRAQDRGIAFFYPDTDGSPGASLGFFGAKAGSRNLVYLLNGSTSGTNIHSGVTGTFEGNFLGKDFRGVCGGSFVFTDSTGKTVGFRAPPAITTPTTWYLPVSDGTNGQLLGTNGAGQLVWDNAEPAGSTGMIQYNDGSGIAAGFSANSNLVFTVAGGLTGTTMSATLLRATGISAAGITTSGLVVTTGITYNGTIAQTRTGSTILPIRNQYKTTRAEIFPGGSLVLNGTTGDGSLTSSTTNLFRFVSIVEPGVSACSGPCVIVLPPGTTTNPLLPIYRHFAKIHISGTNRLGVGTGFDAGGMSTWECVVSGYLTTTTAGYNEPKWYSCDVQCTGRTPFTIVRTGYLDSGFNDVHNVSRTNAVIVLGDNTLKTEWPSWSVDRIDINYGGNFADQTMWEGQFLTSLYGTSALISTANITQGGTSTKKIIEASLTTMPVKLDVINLKATTTTIAESHLFTTQRTFTQSFSAVGSGTSGATVVGDAWLIGSFSDPNSIPAQFKFVHNTHTSNNLQSDLYEWARHYFGILGHSPATAHIFSDWVELPVSISVTYQATRYCRFDVRKKQSGEMQLRMRAAVETVAEGTHYFTFTTTGNTIYTPAAGGAPTTTSTSIPATVPPTGFHGRQSYEFPVSKGNFGFVGSTAGVFILNSGNVGIGTVSPASPLHISAAPDQLLSLEGMGPSSYMRFTSNSLNRGYFGHFDTAAQRGMYLINQRAASELDSSLHLGTADSVKLIITGNGNVGIGTTGPIGKLEIDGDGLDTRALQVNTSATADISLMLYEDSDTPNWMRIRPSDSSTARQQGFLFSDNGDGTVLAVDTKQYRVGIGTKTPAVALDVVGAVKASAWSQGSCPPLFSFASMPSATTLATIPVGSILIITG